MENKTIFLTGANGGLGTAFVKALVALNPKKLYCSARNAQTLQKTQTLSERIEVIELDITDETAVKTMLGKIKKIDVLINNAGANTNTRLFNDTAIDMQVNLFGTMNICKALFEQLKINKAQVINISSILALVNLPLMAEYCISKSALHSFTQALRAELTSYGCEVYEVFPGPIETRMTEDSPIPKTKPEEIVKAVLDGVQKKEFEIFPDAFSQIISKRLKEEPEVVAKEFALSLSST